MFARERFLEILDLLRVKLHQLILLLKEFELSLQLTLLVRDLVLALVRLNDLVVVVLAGLHDSLRAIFDQVFPLLQQLLRPVLLLLDLVADLLLLRFALFNLSEKQVELQLQIAILSVTNVDNLLLLLDLFAQSLVLLPIDELSELICLLDCLRRLGKVLAVGVQLRVQFIVMHFNFGVQILQHLLQLVLLNRLEFLRCLQPLVFNLQRIRRL